MVVTKLFFALPAEPDKSERMELSEFFLCLNNIFVEKGLYFAPVYYMRDENIAIGGKSADSMERGIAGCSLAFFLIDTDSGGEHDEALQEAFRSARENYSKTGKPIIAIYVRQSSEYGMQNARLPLSDATPASSSSGFLIPYSDFYKNTYSHIDTLKLGILMQIKRLSLDGVDISLDNGKAWQGSDALLALDNVDSVARYENLQQLKERRSEIESRFYAARARYLEDPDDAAAYDEFFETSKQRSDAMQQLRDMETQLYNVMEGMYEQTARGKLSKRQAEGYRLIERGLLNEARDMLDFYAIVSESRHDEETAEQMAKRALVHVNELMQLKDVNAALSDWEGVDECFSEAVRIEEKHKLPRKASVDYLLHLISQWKHDEAVELGEKLRHYYKSQESGATDEDMAFILNQLGGVYGDLQRIEEAEEAFEASLSIRRARTDGDPDMLEGDIAIVYNNLGCAYSVSGRSPEAIRAHKSALEIRRKLAKRSPAIYEQYLAYSYVNLGAAYNEVGKYDESVGFMKAARDIFERLAVEKPDPHEVHLTICNINLGGAYTQLHLIEEAEASLTNARDILLKLSETNPAAYEPRLAFSYLRFGNLYTKAGRYAEAEENYTVAVGLYKRIVSRSVAFESELVTCYHGMGELLIETGRLTEAGNALNNAISLYEKYKDSNPAFAGKIVEAQKLLDGLSDPLHRPEEAYGLFTPEEKEVALLLTEGLSQREIARKLVISAAEVGRRVGGIREKVSGISGSGPVIDAVTLQFDLTRREADMLSYLHRRIGNEVIAAELFLSEETVRKHVRALLKKLSIENRHSVPVWLEAYAGKQTQTERQ